MNGRARCFRYSNKWMPFIRSKLIGIHRSSESIRHTRERESALLSVVLNVCDNQKVSAYLEARSPRNVPLFERHRFVAVGSIQVADSPRIIAMLRKPRPMS